MDWAGLKRRTRQVTRMPFPVFNYTITPDSRTIVFVTTEPAGTASVPVIYSIQEDGRRLTRITSGQPPNEGGEGGPGGGGGFGGGFPICNISRDGRTLFFRERDGVYSVRHYGVQARAQRQQQRQQARPGRVKPDGVESTSTFAFASIVRPSGPRCSTMDGAR